MVKSENGQSMVEMALLLPVLLLLLVGIFDLGRVLYTQVHLQMATQETVRLGGLGKSDEEIEQFARNYIHIGDASKLQVTISPEETNRKSGDYMTVTFEYPFEFTTPLVDDLFSSPIRMSAESTIRVE